MVTRQFVNIALIGNPNSGKTSLFNRLTGLNQKVGNFPGVTVDKKTGTTILSENISANIIDLPGTYSLYPKGIDEWISYQVLMGLDTDIQADIFLVVVDASNLKRNLLFCSQVIDLKKPVVIALTMVDLAKKRGIAIDIDGLEREIGIPVVSVNPRKEKGLMQLKKVCSETSAHLYKVPVSDFIDVEALAFAPIKEVQKILPELSNYSAIHYLINHEQFNLNKSLQDKIESIERNHNFNHSKTQGAEILQRYSHIKHVMHNAVSEPSILAETLKSDKLDSILLHKHWGYLILLTVLFLIFQCVFWLAQYPMDLLELGFSSMSAWLSISLPEVWWSDLLINGVLAGFSGIMLFVPQIMILFGIITLLEDSGYMARISFLTDRIMRKFGLNGKSVMPLISGFACAVPSIMSARTIENQKERLLTILIIPLMSCSARLPVYTTLIALVIPNKYFAGFIGLQGLVMLGLYLLGMTIALLFSLVAKRFIKSREKSFFIRTTGL